jgi:hypothetical protein
LFWQFYRSYFSTSFLFELADNGPITRHYLPGQGVLYWFQAPLILAGIALLLVRHSRPGAVLLALLVLFPLSGALSESSPISSRTIAGSVTYALLSGAGIWALASLVETSLARRPRLALLALRGFGAVVVVVAALAFVSYLRDYHNDYPRLSADYWGWQDGPQEIIAQLLSVQDEYDELYLDGTFNAPDIFIPFYAGDRCGK